MELPDDHDLIWLFEQEPELFEPGEPWACNHLTFTLDRDDERLVCMISPAYGDLQLHLTRGDRAVLDLYLGHVTRLTVLKEHGAEVLVVDVGVECVRRLRVQTKPHIHVSWGTALFNSEA